MGWLTEEALRRLHNMQPQKFPCSRSISVSASTTKADEVVRMLLHLRANRERKQFVKNCAAFTSWFFAWLKKMPMPRCAGGRAAFDVFYDHNGALVIKGYAHDSANPRRLVLDPKKKRVRMNDFMIEMSRVINEVPGAQS